MNDNYIERIILSEIEIDYIKNILNGAEWIDGILSTSNMSPKKKNNMECIVSHSTTEANKIIMDAVNKDQIFFDFCIPDRAYTCIFSKTISGGYYKPHQDNGINGHYSTTVFLSNPEDYEGGELCLFLNNTEIRFKPIAGTAITYRTGIMHRVNTVTSGERLAAVFWTKSKIIDPFYRSLYVEIGKAISKCTKREFHETFEDAINDPRFILEEIQNELLRRSK